MYSTYGGVRQVKACTLGFIVVLFTVSTVIAATNGYYDDWWLCVDSCGEEDADCVDACTDEFNETHSTRADVDFPYKSNEPAPVHFTPVFKQGLTPPSVNPAVFSDNIYDRLAGKTVGFAFVISKDGLLVEQGQGGYARIPVLDGGKVFTVNTDVNVYSVSKTITAIAALQLMEKLNLAPDEPISDWLPPSWHKGLGFGSNGITFFDLLTHRTGINQTIAQLLDENEEFAALSNPYGVLHALVGHGINPEFAGIGPVGYAPYSYKNANYILAAILIWRMALATGDITSNSELAADIDSAAGYQHYVRKNVLQPSGVDGFCYATGPASQHALAYDINQTIFPIQVTAGGSMGGSMSACGPMHWWLSAMDLAAIAAHLRFGDLLTPASRELMDELKIGWSQGSNHGTNAHRYWHGGLGMWTRHNRHQVLSPAHPMNPTTGYLPKMVTTKDRVHTCLMKLPGGLNATLVLNSDIRNSSASACSVLTSAYTDSQ